MQTTGTERTAAERNKYHCTEPAGVYTTVIVVALMLTARRRRQPLDHKPRKLEYVHAHVPRHKTATIAY